MGSKFVPIGQSSFSIIRNFLPNHGRILPALTFNGWRPLYVNAGRILPWFGRKFRIIEKLECVIFTIFWYSVYSVLICFDVLSFVLSWFVYVYFENYFTCKITITIYDVYSVFEIEDWTLFFKILLPNQIKSEENYLNKVCKKKRNQNIFKTDKPEENKSYFRKSDVLNFCSQSLRCDKGFCWVNGVHGCTK